MERERAWGFLFIPSGMAIFDIGATQHIIGLSALQAWRRSLEVPTVSTAPLGIGGAAKVSKTVLVPISLGGIPDLVQFAVIENNVPPLLSVGLLEHLGAQMDLVTNRVHFRRIGVDMKMTNLLTKHRAIPLVQWTGDQFPIPQTAKEQFNLEDDAFMKKDSALSAYTMLRGQDHQAVFLNVG